MNKKLLLISILLALLLIPLTIYFLANATPIQIVNNSNYYTVTYIPTPYFTSRLKEWNVFGKDRIKMSQYAPFFTIKSIQVVMTDVKQARLLTYAGNNRNNLLASFGTRVTGNHILIISIYLNPSLSKGLKEDTNLQRTMAINNLFYSGVISTLYDVTHNEEKETRYDAIRNEVRKATSSDNNNPFTIESRNSK